MDVPRPTVRESRSRLFHVDRHRANRCNFHEIEMALRARFRRVELPPEIGGSIGKLRLLWNRFLADKRMVPAKIIESAPSIENDELSPPIGNPGGAIEVLFAAIGIDGAAALR